MSEKVKNPSQIDPVTEMEIRTRRLRLVQGYIEPFSETPSDRGADNDDRIGSHELFSLFTAEIIRQKVVFTR